MKIWSIYRIVNIVNGKAYIGISIDPHRRWREHRLCLPGSPLLRNAIKGNGLELFSFEIIASAISQLDAYLTERYLIVQEQTKHPQGYNLSDGGEGASGYKQSPESIKKRADAIRGHEVSEFTRRKISASLRGVSLPLDEIAAHESELIKNRKKPSTSEERRLKISIALRGKKKSAESIQKTKIGRAATIKEKCATDPIYRDKWRESARHCQNVRWARHRISKIHHRQLFLMIA